MTKKRNHGSYLLANVGATQEEIAARLQCTQPEVSWYLSATRKPSKPKRQKLRSLYKIPVGAWDEPFTPPAKRAPAASSSSSPTTNGGAARTRLEQLEAEVDAVLGNMGDATPRERLRALKSAAEILCLTGKLTGAAQQISETRLMRMPVWQRISDAIIEALEPWPEAMRALGDVLQRLEGGT